jgi:hypothetical protein
MIEVKRVLLGVVTALCPVVLAACYGPPSMMISGKVVDRDTKAGIPEIQLNCRAGDKPQGEIVRSGADGSFALSGRFCETIEVRDMDGPQNGGLYADETVPAPPHGEPLLIEMVKKAP